MQVKIKGTDQEILISTVSIVPEESNELHVLQCIHCSSMVVQFQGKVAKIYPIAEPYDRPLVINRCNQCGTRYTLQMHSKYNTDHTKVILERMQNKNYNIFRCYRHKAGIMVDYVNGNIHTHSGAVSIPFSTTCPDCHHQYFFSDIV